MSKEFVPSEIEETKLRLKTTVDALVFDLGFSVEQDFQTGRRLSLRRPLDDRVLAELVVDGWAEYEEPAGSGNDRWLPGWKKSLWCLGLISTGQRERRLRKDGARMEWKMRWGPKFMGTLRSRLGKLGESAKEILDSPRCPHCRKLMVKRVARKGEHYGKAFWGCTEYPACTGVVAPWKDEALPMDGKKFEDVRCPECGEAMALRYVKKKDHPRFGQKFYGCTTYPTCKGTLDEGAAFGAKLMGTEPPKKEDGDVWNRLIGPP